MSEPKFVPGERFILQPLSSNNKFLSGTEGIVIGISNKNSKYATTGEERVRLVGIWYETNIPQYDGKTVWAEEALCKLPPNTVIGMEELKDIWIPSKDSVEV